MEQWEDIRERKSGPRLVVAPGEYPKGENRHCKPYCSLISLSAVRKFVDSFKYI